MARKNEKSDVWLVFEVMEVSPDKLKGKVFSITGHLGVPRPRVVQLIEQGGGRFEERPRYGTDFLITNADWSVGTVNGLSSKYAQAQRNGIKIITEEEFVQMLVS